MRHRAIDAGAAVFHALHHGGAQLAQQWRIHRQWLIGTLHHDDATPPAQQVRDNIGRERPKHRHVHHADLQSFCVPQIVGDCFGVRHDRTLPHDDPVRVVQPVATGPGVTPAGQRGKFLERPVGECGDVVEVERPLRRHALGVAVLVGHHTEHGRIVEVEQFRNATALLAEDDALRRRG